MAARLKDDLEWDFGTYISKVNMVHSKVSGAIKRFSSCLDLLEKEDKSETEIKEDLQTIKIEESLFQSLIDLGENLKNKNIGLITKLVDVSVEFINKIIEKTKTKIE